MEMEVVDKGSEAVTVTVAAVATAVVAMEAAARVEAAMAEAMVAVVKEMGQMLVGG